MSEFLGLVARWLCLGSDCRCSVSDWRAVQVINTVIGGRLAAFGGRLGLFGERFLVFGERLEKL